jgi:hypothetical protein
MKRPFFIALLGLVLGIAAFGILYSSRTADFRSLERECGPELAWIKMEFELDDVDFEKVRHLHEAYKPVCAEMCRQIDEQNHELAKLLDASTGVTPEMEQMLTRASQLRQQCQTRMLAHFFQVSQAMPREQGQRYLRWMFEQTIAPSHQSMLPKVNTGSAHDGHHH